jgi:hypothetical protein
VNPQTHKQFERGAERRHSARHAAGHPQRAAIARFPLH